jgi:biopolymer transport protein ExbD
MARFKGVDAEEQVACNLIPMIDIMFLLLLFFMLSADMSQRVTEDITLPLATMVQPDEKKGDFPSSTLNIVKDDDGTWVVKEAGNRWTFDATLKPRLIELADDKREPDQKVFSNREVMIRAQADCPYREVQRLIQMCGTVGLYKTSVVATKPVPDTKP